jgi:ferritin-like metal-binding protein YciE
MSVETPEELLIDELKDIYSAEKQAVRAYPALAKKVQSDELKEALQEHLEETKQQVERLERVFEILETRAGGKTCEGMKGLLDEASQHVEEIEQGPLLDAALIGALQRVEHYEIAAYGTVATLAEAMGQEEIQELLGETLDEEKATDEKLTEVAQAVNSEALTEQGNAESGDEDEDAEETVQKKGQAPKRTAKKASGKTSGRTAKAS